MVNDPGEIPEDATFDEGLEVGMQLEADKYRDLQDEIESRLVSESGMSPEEAQAFFDPAARRRHRGKVHCSAKQRAKMPQICKGSRYDPAPRRHKKSKSKRYTKRTTVVHKTYDPASHKRRYRYTHKSRGRGRRYDPAPMKTSTNIMNAVVKFTPPVVGLGLFYTKYNDRLTALKGIGAKNQNGTPVASIVDAIMYDIYNWNTAGGLSGASTRIKADLVWILGTLIGGPVLEQLTKRTRYAKAGQLVGRSAMWAGGALALKDLLDPPLVSPPVQMPAPQAQMPAPQTYPVQSDSAAQRYLPSSTANRVRMPTNTVQMAAIGPSNPY
jgi:hypothetical protein